ncbi:hypothetical protein ALC57_15060 [Trachymyrmex cornetzi]|uniref:Uncharacterized protein n=1 Tax=Trachymyrmex cornetzi TaxID=471704 RepID=A0A195DIW2_9HYME|nr:hypothetical protein ALC57_15060 [Trachymyrmex cornetzi]
MLPGTVFFLDTSSSRISDYYKHYHRKKIIASLKENNTTKLLHFIVIFRTLQLCYLSVNLRLYGKQHHHGPRNFQSVVPKVDSDVTSGFVYVSQKLQIIATAGAAQAEKRARRKRGLSENPVQTTSFHDYSQRLEIAPSILSESREPLLDDVSSRHFPLPTEFLWVQLCFPRCFGRCIYRRKWKWNSRTTVMRIEQTRESQARRRCRSSSLTPDNPTTKYTHLKCSLLFFFNDKC